MHLVMRQGAKYGGILIKRSPTGLAAVRAGRRTAVYSRATRSMSVQVTVR